MQMLNFDSVARSLLMARSNRAMATRCTALLRPSSVRTGRRHCASKEREQVEEFLKKTKIRFLEINQFDTEEKLTRIELLLLAGSVLFFATLIGCYFYLYKREFPTEVDYEKYTYDPNKKNAEVDEEKKETWKDHPMFKQV